MLPEDVLQLQDYIKNKLRYGVDEDEDISLHIEDGIAFIESITGTNINFIDDGFAKALLTNYVRYSLNNATELFEDNFRKELLRLNLIEGVKHNVE